PWPEVVAAHQDARIEAQFAKYQATLKAINEIRAQQDVPTKNQIAFSLRCSREDAALLEPMAPYFKQMTNAAATAFGPEVAAPPLSASIKLASADIDVFVDLRGHIDVAKEIDRNTKQEQKLLGLIEAKEKKLSSAAFVDKAPADVVQKERESLTQLKE